MCGTPGGAVPLGMYLTNEMSIASMGLIFEGLSTLVGSTAYNGRGSLGPHSAIADDGIEIKGFIEVFPKCRRRRCCFHIFQNGEKCLRTIFLKNLNRRSQVAEEQKK